MALDNYGVVIGALDHFERDPPDDFGKFLHGHIFVSAPDNGTTKLFNCAVDVNKPQGDIEYLHLVNLDLSKFHVVPYLPDGHHVLARTSTSGALDYVRHPLITVPVGCAGLFLGVLGLLSGSTRPVWTTNHGTEALDALESSILAGNIGRVFVFGARYDNAAQMPPQGMHDIHYNQGDPPGPFQHLDAIWQDGGVIMCRDDGRFDGFFVKFATQSLHTDANGLPV